jgi:hypothetical protein
MDDGALAILVLGGICLLLYGIVSSLVKALFGRPWTSSAAYPPPDSWVVYHRYPPPVVVEYHLPPARIVRRSRWVDVVDERGLPAKYAGRPVLRDETEEWAAPQQVEYEDAEWREAPRAVPSSRKMLPRPE